MTESIDVSSGGGGDFEVTKSEVQKNSMRRLNPRRKGSLRQSKLKSKKCSDLGEGMEMIESEVHKKV